MAGNTNAADRLPSRIGLTEVEIFTVNDFPAPSGGVITLPTGHYKLKAPITLSDRFEIEADATVKFCSEQFDNTLTYTGTGTFISAPLPAADIRVTGIFMFLTGVGAQAFEIDAMFQEMDSVGVFSLAAGQSIGMFGNGGTPMPFVFFMNVQFSAFASGIAVDNASVFSLSGVAITSALSGSGTLITVGSNVRVTDLDNLTLTAGASESAIFLDPNLAGRAIVRDTTLQGSTLFFAAGATGAITAFADAAFASESITSVSDSGGVARFNFTPAPTLFVGQEVTISGYVTNTAYNVTGLITVTGAGFFEISSVVFGTDEAGGSFVSDTVTVTSATHGLSDGQTLLITDTIEYNGGAAIYNALTNSYQINRAFVATETGNWDTGSLDESDPRVDAASNTGQKPSMNIGSVIANGITVSTLITTQNVWVDLDLDGLAVGGSNIELWTMVDADTGELRYDGLEPLFGALLATISALSQGGAQEFQFRAVKNGSPLSDGVVAAREIGGILGSLTLLAPITVEPGDLVRLQVQNVSGTFDIDISFLSVQVT
jgi:hypothetical protein